MAPPQHARQGHRQGQGGASKASQNGGGLRAGYGCLDYRAHGRRAGEPAENGACSGYFPTLAHRHKADTLLWTTGLLRAFGS